MMDSLLSWRPETWFEYLLLYITPGALIIIYLLVSTWLEKPSDFAKGLMKIMGKEEKLLDRLKEAGVYGIALICVLVGWPGFMIWFIKEKRNNAVQQKFYDAPDFNCLPEHLVAIVNPVDAEIASYIIDPLASVPALPFGHLNKGWVNFLTDMNDDRDEMWAFYVSKGSKCGKHRFAATSDLRGYARVRDGQVLGEFITESN
ncbi:hypothetical protein ICU98_06915 [Polynucleobacter sp. MWH-P3-07-1]|uniref:hypothetical protein n=1 Tax=Polynucleobacter sp. MWH-P3-07-1 TaxID=1743173 RepID=UPI001BFE0F29|nr:hypothetical protein [Polynucleobacter sp. MWH-P3-07-1]QWD83160.1 hypothetical protein ICU98_06915 [Polynucleobacter sp. MWH-P3-07-1]